MEWNLKEEIADYLFKDCDRIAQEYESKLVVVVTEFTRLEAEARELKRDDRYITLIRQTEEHFKQQYNKIEKK